MDPEPQGPTHARVSR